MDKCLVSLSLCLYSLFIRLYSFINCNWEKSEKFEINPTSVIDFKKGYKTRERFLETFEEGISYWKNLKKKEEAKEYKSYSLTLSDMLESRLGYGALYPGTFPND